jgi:CDP-glycerol glycerophosphotransferase (TagB/SpsB family)
VCGAAGGYPKLDPAFNGSIKQESSQLLREKLNFDTRPVVLFSATWEGSGLSAIENWYDQLEQITENYNIIVTLHPWVKSKYRKKLAETKRVILLKAGNILPYMMLADLMVGDTSSILAEFCALKKPIITFRIGPQKRLEQEVVDLIGQISLQIENFKQLPDAIEHLLINSDQLQNAQEAANHRFFRSLNGDHSGHCLSLIKDFLRSRSIELNNF